MLQARSARSALSYQGTSLCYPASEDGPALLSPVPSLSWLPPVLPSSATVSISLPPLPRSQSSWITPFGLRRMTSRLGRTPVCARAMPARSQ